MRGNPELYFKILMEFYFQIMVAKVRTFNNCFIDANRNMDVTPDGDDL